MLPISLRRLALPATLAGAALLSGGCHSSAPVNTGIPPAPTDKPKAKTFNVPTLLSSNLKGITAQLGTPTGVVPPDVFRKTGPGKVWTKDGYTLAINFGLDKRPDLVTFEMPMSSATPDRSQAFAAASLDPNSHDYAIFPLMSGGKYYIGAIVTPSWAIQLAPTPAPTPTKAKPLIQAPTPSVTPVAGGATPAGTPKTS